MKRLFFLAVAIFAAVFSANAQENEPSKDEIAVSWGYGTFPHLIDGMTNVIVNTYTGDLNSTVSLGAFSVRYMHRLSKVFGIGALSSYEYMYRKEADSSKKYGDNILTFMPTVKASWYRSEDYALYSRVALGVALEMYNFDGKDKQDVLLGFQFTPVAVEIGRGNLHGFFELGFGHQGILTAGVSLGL